MVTANQKTRPNLYEEIFLSPWGVAVKNIDTLRLMNHQFYICFTFYIRLYPLWYLGISVDNPCEGLIKNIIQIHTLKC